MANFIKPFLKENLQSRMLEFDLHRVLCSTLMSNEHFECFLIKEPRPIR